MSKPRLLDLFCGAGGCTKGYQRAGFYVVGVDINPQPHYCGDEFHRGDALTWPLDGFDSIHASPPCQAHSTMGNRWRDVEGTVERFDLLTPTLDRLRGRAEPWIVENVEGAAPSMRAGLRLHGGMFGLGVHRPRLFESNVLLMAPRTARVRLPVGVYGDKPDGRHLNLNSDGQWQRAANSLEEAQKAMGMDWADWHGTKEAIPPAYTEWIGRQLLDHLEVAA